MIDQRALSEFRSDEDQAVNAALAVAAGLSDSGQHFAAATVRVLVDYLARSRAEQAAMFGGEPPPAVPAPMAAHPAADGGPKAAGGKRGRPPKVRPSSADASPPVELSGSSASSTAPPTLPAMVPAEAVTVAEVPAAPAAVTA